MNRGLVRLLFILLAAIWSAAAPAAKVEFFSPQGEIKGVRQVTARFSAPMVALGDPRLPAPFDIECSAAGTARWADTRNWVYDFGRDLPAGVRCTQLTADLRCALFGRPERPRCCSGLAPSAEMCGASRDEAVKIMQSLP